MHAAFHPPEGPIMVAPLNWGLGHATRCYPIIKSLLEAGREVIIASDGLALQWLRHEFPKLEHLSLPGYDVRYGKGRSQRWSILRQLPKLYQVMEAEHALLTEYCEQHHLGAIIADHRLGMYQKGIHSVLLAHQLRIPDRAADLGLNRLHRQRIARFDEVWIPDDAERRWSGAMSDVHVGVPKHYIGPLSRLRRDKRVPDIPVLALVSGPEPQRSLLVEALIEVLSSVPGSILVGASPEAVGQRGGCEVFGVLDSTEVQEYVSRANRVITRSGYSSITDLVTMKKGGVLIPTPGQPEQEYLAKLHDGNHGFCALKQGDIASSLLSALNG